MTGTIQQSDSQDRIVIGFVIAAVATDAERVLHELLVAVGPVYQRSSIHILNVNINSKGLR